MKKWTACCSNRAAELSESCREKYCACPDASSVLGVASCRIYNYIRNELSMPFLRTKDLIKLESESTFDGHECPPRRSEGSNSTSPTPKARLKRERSNIEETEHVAEGQDPVVPVTTPIQVSGVDRFQTSHFERKVHASNNKPEKKLNIEYPKDDQTDSASTVGSYVSIIYEALRSGVLYEPISWLV